MQAYSLDLRLRILAEGEEGLKTKPVAAKYQVSAFFVRFFKRRRRETGEVAACTGGNLQAPLAVRHGEAIRQAVAEQPDRTLAELRDALGLSVSLATLHRALADRGLTLKKSPHRPPNKTGPMSPQLVPLGH